MGLPQLEVEGRAADTSRPDWLHGLDAAAKAHTPHDLRCHPSTHEYCPALHALSTANVAIYTIQAWSPMS